MSRSPDQVLSRRGLAVLLGSAVGCILVAPGLGGVARSEDSNVDVETIERALKGRRTRVRRRKLRRGRRSSGSRQSGGSAG